MTNPSDIVCIIAVAAIAVPSVVFAALIAVDALFFKR